MISCFSNLKRLIFVVGAMLAAVSLAHAQTTMKRGQPIFFSAPDNDAMVSNAPSLTPRSPELPEFTKTIEVPSLNFEAGRPMPRPLPLSPAQMAAMQQSLDREKNWTLMTPAEILGVPTPEKILGIPERDATGARKNQTITERYLERENARQTGVTNGAAIFNSSPEWNFQNRQQARLNPEFSGS